MPLPQLAGLPSETTVAEASNRMILQTIGDLSAWILSPSNIREKELGYDANILSEDTKVAVIQYKRRYTGSGGSVDARITTDQHRTLRSAYPGPGLVYYAWGDFASYWDLGEAHQLGTVLRRMIFVDAQDFPLGTTRLKRRPSGELLAVTPKGSPVEIPFCSGEQWAASLKSCETGMGLPALLRLDSSTRESSAGGLGQIRYLIWQRS